MAPVYNIKSAIKLPETTSTGSNIGNIPHIYSDILPHIPTTIPTTTDDPFADDNFSSFLALAAHLGLRLSTTEGHISPPGPVCIALRLQYDVDNNTISLPEDKVVALTTLLKEWLDKPKATEKELASLAGKLLNTANVFFAGRLFLNRVLATKRRASRLKHSTVSYTHLTLPTKRIV